MFLVWDDKYKNLVKEIKWNYVILNLIVKVVINLWFFCCKYMYI